MDHAIAAPAQQAEDILFATLLQLIVIILAARCASIALRRMGQPAVVGEILAGLLLGPSLLGYALPGVSHFLFSPIAALPITIMSQIGLIFLMFQIGSEFEFGHLAQPRNKTAVIAISVASIMAPFWLGLLIGSISAPILAPSVEVLPYCLFIGVALAITAIPVLGRIMRDFDLTPTAVGTIAISAAAVNDVVGWLLLAGVSAYATMHFSAIGSLLQVVGIVAFAAVFRLAGTAWTNGLLRIFPMDGGRISPGLMTSVIAMVLGFGICTHLLGIFAIFGGFAAGLLFHRHPAFVAAWRHQIGQFVAVFFVPLYFTYTGLRTNVLGLTTQTDWMWCSIFLSAAVVGKVASVYAAGRLSGLSPSESSVIGVLMNTRGLMELIVLNIGFDLGFIPQHVFTMLVIMALATTFMTAPLLRLALPRVHHRLVARPET
jgi:Kef-type K+ transport system membrane component KefB